jgi:hypothetical protein
MANVPKPLPPKVIDAAETLPPPVVKTQWITGVLFSSHSTSVSAPSVRPCWPSHATWPSAPDTTPVDANIAPRTRAPDATRPMSFRLFMFVCESLRAIPGYGPDL